MREKRNVFYCKSKFVEKNGQFGLFELHPNDLQYTFDHMERNVSLLLDQFRDKPKLVAMDIFSGCGGLSLGLTKAGIDVRYSIEFWNVAADSHHANFPNAHTFCKDAEEFLKNIKVVNELKKRFGLLDSSSQHKSSVKRKNIHIKTLKKNKDGSLSLLIVNGNSSKWKDVDELQDYRDEIIEFLETKYYNIPKPNEIDLIAGGPPCQGFSGLNRFKEREASKYLSHDKNRLVLTFLEYVKYFKPKYVLIENVTGLLNTTVLDVLQAIISKLDSRGYDTQFSCLNARHFGVSNSKCCVQLIELCLYMMISSTPLYSFHNRERESFFLLQEEMAIILFLHFQKILMLH